MTLVARYLRSRATGTALLWLSLLAALTAALTDLARDSDSLDAVLLLASVVAPLALAVVIGASARSPFGDVERGASYPLTIVRLLHLLGLIAWALAGLLLATWWWPPDGFGPLHDPLWSLARNLAGLTGLALLANRLLGPAAGWAVPLAYATLAFFGRVTRDGPLVWAWPMQPGLDRLAGVIAVALLFTGLAVVADRGTDAGDDEAV